MFTNYGIRHHNKRKKFWYYFAVYLFKSKAWIFLSFVGFWDKMVFDF